MSVDEAIKLVQIVSENRLTSLKLKEGELKLSLEREKEIPQTVVVSAPSADTVSMQMAAVQNSPASPSMTSPAMMSQSAASPQVVRDVVSGVGIGSDKVITFPLVGIFYNTSSPDTASFVQAEDTVGKGQVLGIIEAMEPMSETKSEYDGVVGIVLMSNEEVVEYGQLLFHIE